MTRKQLTKRLSGMPQAVRDITGLESVNILFGHRPRNVFNYAAMCEGIFKNYLEDVGKKGTDGNWTWYHDLSISEWCIPMEPNAIIETCTHAFKYWADNSNCMSVFLLSLGIKASEHYQRGNRMWSMYYSALYEWCRELVYDYYEGDNEKTHAVWSYLD